MNRNILRLLQLGVVCLIVASAVTPAWAQGRIIPPPILPPRPIPPPMPPPTPPPTPEIPLHLKQLAVSTEITDGVAVTAVKQTFYNRSGRQIEGTYVFPLPDDAAVGSFKMSINGKEMHGEVLDAATARRTYEEIVRRTRDPGLLEYLGSRLYKASIFPIPPGGVAEIELQYTQTIRESGGLGLYRHPLRNAAAHDDPIEQFVMYVKLRSQLPLASVFCPTHKCEILRPNDREATVSFEQADVRLDRDFQLYYQRSEATFGLSLLTHRGAGEAGYFLLRISPRIEIGAEQIQPKDIAFVIDTSGSMRGRKIEQVKESLEFCVNSLNEGDRFNVYTFSTEVHPFRDQLVAADSDIKAAAVEFTGKLEALGGTNIHGALLAALAADPGDQGRPYLIVFMTDGKPTVDVTEPDAILKSVEEKNTQRVRFHVLGVGTDVNTHLLDKLAETNRGSRDYCDETEDLELKLSALAVRLANPVLTDITLAIPGLKTSDVYPHKLPDLFSGGDLVVLGRYDGAGEHALEVTGRLLGETKRITYEGSFPAKSSDNDFLPRLWAQRKVAYLLDQIRLHGSDRELVDEVVRLAKRHGIVTPYTSALIVEDDERITGGGRRFPAVTAPPTHAVVVGAAREAVADLNGVRAGWAESSGEAAVKASADLHKLQSLGYVGEAKPVELGGRQIIRHVGEKTFVLDGQRWIDTAWDGQRQPKKIIVFSDEYFALLERHPRLARFFALGERVLVVYDGTAYETTCADKIEGDD